MPWRVRTLIESLLHEALIRLSRPCACPCALVPCSALWSSRVATISTGAELAAGSCAAGLHQDDHAEQVCVGRLHQGLRRRHAHGVRHPPQHLLL